ncbi:MAG: DUF4037 domain-containing protein [Clostridia bacterium]|nr:DUF4037 domain-containing protein [Clostridia bacterium]
MNGLELSRKYYEEFGKPMIYEKFPHLVPYVAAGLCGQGSECLGFDDEVSRDHDFEPGFIVFLPDEDIIDRRQAFLLERAYSSLPKEFCGVRRSNIAPVGGARHGVIRTADFFNKTVGTPDGSLSLTSWLTVPDCSLCEATNGEIFEDNYGEVTKIRKNLSSMPEDARRKRLSGRLLMMAQSGQYNYPRCLAHGETAAAQLCAFEFSKRGAEAVFLLNRRPMPYYKWSFRAMRSLDTLSDLADTFEYLITADNSPENADTKKEVIESVCKLISDEVAARGIASPDAELERLAYAVNDSIKNPAVRSMNIFCTL